MSGADRRVLDEAGGLRAMTWVMAIMLFLTVLAAALGLGTRQSAALLERQLAGRLTVQVVEGSPLRDMLAARTLAVVRALPGVRGAAAVDRAELARLLAPWLGSAAADADLPVPAMIDVDLAAGADPERVIAAVKRVSAASRVDRHQRWMSPVGGFLDTLTWLALGLVVLMLVATGAVVVLAARAGLETHRATIEVMHMLGSTDVQVARLFQRRIALDAALGGAAGGLAALAVLAFLGTRLAALGSQLLDGITLGAGDWALLALLPLGFVVLATAAARLTVTGAFAAVAVIVRLFGLIALAWCLGFAAFMLLLPGPLEGNTTDAIVVPTGAGRIDRGIVLLRARQARRMLVTGVAPGVRPIDLAREYRTPAALFACCIDLGADAVDTRSNAEETAAWVKAHGYRTVRLVTSDWHAPRARMELSAAMGPGVLVLGDGVPSAARIGTLINEYDKLILRRVALWLGMGA